MEDLNESYGISNMLAEYPPVGEAPPDDIFEEPNNNSLDSSLGMSELSMQVPPLGPSPPDDLFEVEGSQGSDCGLLIGSTRASFSELLTPGPSEIILEAFSPMDEQVSANEESGSSDTSRTLSCSDDDQAHQPLPEHFYQNDEPLDAEGPTPVHSRVSTPTKPRSSSFVLDGVSASPNHYHSPQVVHHQFGSPSSNHHRIHDSAMDSPSTSSRAVFRTQPSILRRNPRWNSRTDSSSSTSSQVVRQTGSPYSPLNYRQNSATNLISASPHVIHLTGSQSSHCPRRHNSAANFVQYTTEQTVNPSDAVLSPQSVRNMGSQLISVVQNEPALPMEVPQPLIGGQQGAFSSSLPSVLPPFPTTERVSFEVFGRHMTLCILCRRLCMRPRNNANADDLLCMTCTPLVTIE